ncbi:hypothetical protein F2Q70_00035207 [Brassica cretica]|uniref:Uncharacterized protein n=1 Tax=Brassica cretica TaxID=69181 RepID=A0A8S9JWX1_BRACR|nr:hypothetical protein F2Q70_00035207 [Brassica cretica]
MDEPRTRAATRTRAVFYLSGLELDQEHLRAGADRMLMSWNASKNNLGFFGVSKRPRRRRVLFLRVWARLRSDRQTVCADGFVSSRA